MEEIGHPGTVPYTCRHTFINSSIRSGVDLPVLKAIVGHVDRETTKIYTNLRAADLVESVEIQNLTVCNKSITRQNRSDANMAKKLAK
jgi:site-specific recombinase XerD